MYDDGSNLLNNCLTQDNHAKIRVVCKPEKNIIFEDNAIKFLGSGEK